MVRIIQVSHERTGTRKGTAQRKVGIRSYEVTTEDGGVYRRNR